MRRPCKMLQLARPCQHEQLASPSNLEGLAGNSKGFPGMHSSLHWTCPVSLARPCESWGHMLHLAPCWAWQGLASHGQMLHHIGTCWALHSLVSHGEAFCKTLQQAKPNKAWQVMGRPCKMLQLARPCQHAQLESPSNLEGLGGNSKGFPGLHSSLHWACPVPLARPCESW